MNIFISYRRQDSEWVTLSIYNELKQHLPEDEIFKDFNTIKPGEDFTKAIDKHLQSCTILLVVIGNQWLSCKDSDGNLRLFNEKDFVRLEIARALKKGKKVIPILIDNAIMPKEEELPDNLKQLHTKQSLRINNTNFELDVFNLVNAIKEATGQSTQYSELLKDITSGKINERELMKPDSHKMVAMIAMAIGLVLLLLNYKQLNLIFTSLGVIVSGAFAYFLSNQVIPLWLSKQFDEARSKAKTALSIAIIAPLVGTILMFVLKKKEKIEPSPIVKTGVNLNGYSVGTPRSVNKIPINAVTYTTKKLPPINRTNLLKPLQELKPNGNYPQTSERYLIASDVNRLSNLQLKRMRNEIFARKGLIFSSQDLYQYFSKQAWYKPRYSDVSNSLSEIEKYNINFIKSYEN